ncbi:MAG TPA: hypothetical protein VFX37_10510 [Pseudolabrys sp.]|nr:hypothetical protein [Pseudolabrys sp.]
MTVGTAPPKNSRQALQDGLWLRGLANGQNRSAQSNITAAAGGTKAAAFQLPAAVSFIEVTTVASAADSVLAPQAKAGTEFCIYNAGANTLDIYGRGTDTINGAATATAYALGTGVSARFFCVVDGAWAAIKSA